MRISPLSFLLLFFSIETFACSFRKDIKGLYSLSGPVTVILKEVGLLSSSRLEGISTFHPISSEEFKGKILPGGIFLSRSQLEELKGKVIFYDESRELGKILGGVGAARLIEIKSRGLTPEETVEKVLKDLASVTELCEKRFENVMQKSQQLSVRIKKQVGALLKGLFFLGEIRGGKLPELLIVNDGIVRWLIAEKKLQTYPSPLAYVNWSSKILQEECRGMIRVGVKDSGSDMKKELRKEDGNTFNLVYPGSLVPGLSQQEAWLYFLENYQR